MSTSNTETSFGRATRTLHWLTALLILTAILLGLIANQLPATPESMALKTQLFSLHKTLGVAAFLVALARILRRAMEEAGLWQRLVHGIAEQPTLADCAGRHLALFDDLKLAEAA